MDTSLANCNIKLASLYLNTSIPEFEFENDHSISMDAFLDKPSRNVRYLTLDPFLSWKCIKSHIL